MNQTALALTGAALILGACASSGEEPLPAFVDAADRSASCAESVLAVAQRRVEEAAGPQAKQFAQARLERMEAEPPTSGNTVCYVAHVEEDGELKLNGIYTNASYVNKTLRLAKYDPHIAYTYFRITNPPGRFSRSVVFKLSERLDGLNIEGGLLTKFDDEIREQSSEVRGQMSED
ncbi:MAG: hypothetical protein ACLFWF_11080 [Alphaproteobacteria bacterium]